MGKHWGELAKIRGVVFFRQSPFEQKPFAGAITKGIPNMMRRIREEIFVVVPPFIVGYMIYAWTKETSYKLSRKNPKDFENDV